MKKILFLLFIILIFIFSFNLAFATTQCYVPHGGDFSLGGGTYQKMYNSTYVSTDLVNGDKHEYKVKTGEDACSDIYRNLPERDLTNDGSKIFLHGNYSIDTYIEGHDNSSSLTIQIKGFKDTSFDGMFNMSLYEFNPTTNLEVGIIGSVESDLWIDENLVYDVDMPITPKIISAGNTLMLKVEAKNDVCPDIVFEHKFKVDEPQLNVDTTFTNTYCDSFASDYKNWIAIVLNETEIELGVDLLEPTNDFVMLVNDVFDLSCNATNEGGTNFTQINLFARYTNITVLPISGGFLSLNESGNFSCGSLGAGQSCIKTWQVTANQGYSNLNLECYAENSVTQSSLETIRVDILESINNLTLSLDKGTYSNGETITAEMMSSVTNAPYILLFRNSTGYVIENLSGTTPLVANQPFFRNHLIVNHPNEDNATVMFYISETISINQTVLFNISTLGALDYAITNILLKFDETFLGYSQSVKGTVVDNETELAIGECCRVQVDDAITLAPIFTSDTELIDGAGSCETHWLLNKDHFEAPKSYAVEVIAWQCSNEDLPSNERKRGVGRTSFDVIQYITEEDALIPVVDTELWAGFDEVELTHERTNNFGQPIETSFTIWFANVGTEADYHYDFLTNEEGTINVGTSVKNHKIKIPEDLPTGTYRVEANAFYLYQGDIKEFSFVKSEDFNVSSIQDIMVTNSITMKDYFGTDVDVSLIEQDLTDIPESNFSSPHIILTEGFGYQICGNITNNYDSNIYWHLQNLVLHNPVTGQSFEEFHRDTTHVWQRILNPGVNEICWNSNIPLTVETHSDWHFMFDTYVGDEQRPFICELGGFSHGDECKFTGVTDYFYTTAIEDSIVFDKWYTNPTNISVGTPLTYIVTAREEYLSMNDDCEYKSQEEIPWDTANVTCFDKNDNTTELKIDYDIYPVAGEKMKVCFQIQNYFSNEIDLELYDFYLDDDSGETVIYFQGEETENYVPSITNDKLYLTEEPSRAFEQSGILIDGYSNMCSKWIDLPSDIKGGNDWDIQGKVRINPDLYNLDNAVVWNWESDEFPIYGLRDDKTRYIEVNTITDSDSYKIGDELYVCANVSSLYPEQLDMEIKYNYRCSANQDDDATDRNLYGEHTETRGIGANSVQNQCHKFIIPNDYYFKTLENVFCYASSIVDIPLVNERVTSSSSFFNVSKHNVEMTLTPVDNYNLYIADNYELNISFENPFLYREEQYEAHYSIEIQADNSLIYVLVEEVEFNINESQKTLSISLPINSDGIYRGDLTQHDFGSGWLPEKRDAFFQTLNTGDKNVSIILDMHTHTSAEVPSVLHEHEATFKQIFSGFIFKRPGVVYNTAVLGQASGIVNDENIYLDENGLLHWYAMFNETVTEAPDGTYSTIPRRSWITIEGDQDQIRRCENNYDYTLYNNASTTNIIYLRHTCDFETSQLLINKEVQFYLQGIWNSAPYVFGTLNISQPVEVNSFITNKNDYIGGEVIYISINSTGHKQQVYDIEARLETESGLVIYVWDSAVEHYDIKIGTTTTLFPLLLPVKINGVPYSGEYELEVVLTNKITGKIDIETETDINITPFIAIVSENITSSTIDNNNPITIEYEVNIPLKDMLYFPNLNQPFRIKYNFINDGGQAISQFTTIDGQYAPLEAYALFPADSTQTFNVTLQPTNLEPGNYTIIEEIEIDPIVNNQAVWEGIYKGELGTIEVTEQLTGEPKGLVDTVFNVYGTTNDINSTVNMINVTTTEINITTHLIYDLLLNIDSILDEINGTVNNINITGDLTGVVANLTNINTNINNLAYEVDRNAEFYDEMIFLITDSEISMNTELPTEVIEDLENSEKNLIELKNILTENNNDSKSNTLSLILISFIILITAFSIVSYRYRDYIFTKDNLLKSEK